MVHVQADPYSACRTEVPRRRDRALYTQGTFYRLYNKTKGTHLEAFGAPTGLYMSLGFVRLFLGPAWAVLLSVRGNPAAHLRIANTLIPRSLDRFEQ